MLLSKVVITAYGILLSSILPKFKIPNALHLQLFQSSSAQPKKKPLGSILTYFGID